MKRTFLMLLVMGASMFFFACDKLDPVFLDPVADQQTAELKGTKAGNTFTGICTNVLTNEEVNEWYDATDDWRTTGSTFWVQPDPEVFEGTCTMIVDARNPHEESAGKWAISWEGTMTFLDDGTGAFIFATAVGTGIEGKVEGLVANWTYTMNWVFSEPETFVYAIEGKIIPPGQAKRQ